MGIERICGTLVNGLSSSKVVQKTCRAGAKYFKKAPVTTKNVAGLAVKTNHLTGTQFTKLADGTKSVVLGSGNRLSKILGEGTSVVSYPKGSFFGGKEGLICLSGKNVNQALSFTPKEYKGFLDMMKELNKIYA